MNFFLQDGVTEQAPHEAEARTRGQRPYCVMAWRLALMGVASEGS